MVMLRSSTRQNLIEAIDYLDHARLAKPLFGPAFVEELLV